MATKESIATYMQTGARWISNVMNPFPITLALLLLVSYTGSVNLRIFAIWALIILFCFIALPFTYIFVKNMAFGGNKLQFQEPTAFFREHRKDIGILGMIAVAVFIPTLIFFKAPSNLYATFAALAGTSLAVAFVNRYLKASFHLALITSVVVTIALLWGQKALPVIAIIPLVGWSRFFLRQHSPHQLAAGFGLAVLVSIPILYYFPSISS